MYDSYIYVFKYLSICEHQDDFLCDHLEKQCEHGFARIQAPYRGKGPCLALQVFANKNSRALTKAIFRVVESR